MLTFPHSDGALGGDSTAAAAGKHEHRPPQRHESVRGARTRAVQKAHVRGSRLGNKEFRDDTHLQRVESAD